MNSPAISETSGQLTEQRPPLSDTDSVTGARQRRLQRTNAAVFLVSLNAPCTPEELDAIEWQSLDAVPHWCFLTPDALRYLQLLCGAVFIAPSMVRWIDGERIQSVCRLIGSHAYTRIIASVPHQTDTDYPLDTDIESVLLRCGENVLLGSIVHPGIGVLLQAMFHAEAAPLDNVTAARVYQQALSFYDQAMAQAAAERQAAESVANPAAESA